MRMPSCSNSAVGVSNEHSEPERFFSPPSVVSHIASRTFTTNHPAPVGARPDPDSWSGASGTRAKLPAARLEQLTRVERLRRDADHRLAEPGRDTGEDLRVAEVRRR